DIKRIPEIKHERYLPWFSRVDSKLRSVVFQESWDSYRQVFDDSTLALIDICDDQLRQHTSVPIVNVEELAKLKLEIESLRKSPSLYALDRDALTYVIRQLDLISRAIDEYWLRGKAALDVGFRDVIGVQAICHIKGTSPPTKDTEPGAKF